MSTPKSLKSLKSELIAKEQGKCMFCGKKGEKIVPSENCNKLLIYCLGCYEVNILRKYIVTERVKRQKSIQLLNEVIRLRFDVYYKNYLIKFMLPFIGAKEDLKQLTIRKKV